MPITCPHCGDWNYFPRGSICSKCGKDMAKSLDEQDQIAGEEMRSSSRARTRRASLGIAEPIATEREEATSALTEHRNDAQMSTAVNIRRVALVLILALILYVGTDLVEKAIEVFITDSESQSTAYKVWLAFAGLAMIVGLYSIIFEKRLTKL